MAFPVTGILDDFNRANENPLAGGTNWSGPFWNGGTRCKLLSNACTSSVANDYTEAVWVASTVGPDCEVYATISGDFSFFELVTRGVSYGTAGVDGYAVDFDIDGNSIEIYRVDNGSSQLLGLSVSQTLNSGDKVGVEMIGDTLTVYRYSGGAWASVATRTDATYTAAGYIGFMVYDTGIVDDFGGGTIAAASTTTQLATRARNDNGSESAATTIADGNFTAPLDTNVRIRVQVDTTGDVVSTAYQLEAQKSGDLVWAKVT